MASSGILTDYYQLLGIPSTVSTSEVREAYKKAALSTHPDRFPVNSREAGIATQRFQEVNDAYYTLGDPDRRREYDKARKYQQSSWNPFSGGAGAEKEPEQRSEEQFGSAFEEMLREEGVAPENKKLVGKYSLIGSLSGAALGFILANIPGAMAGLLAGNRLGAIRDTKGKAVYQVFQDLPQAEKARVLSDLARRVFTQVT